MDDDDLDPAHNNPLKMFVLSSDTFRRERIDQRLPEGSSWSHKPPLFLDFGSKSKDRHTVKFMCRTGIPDALRCAVWLTNVTRATNPAMSVSDIDRHATLEHVRVLEHGFAVALKSVFPDASDELNITMPDYGLNQDQIDHILQGNDSDNKDGPDQGISESGRRTFTRLLYIIRRLLDIEYCPLIPKLVQILLTRMSDSYAYSVIRDMTTKAQFFLPTSKIMYISWCKTFADLMVRVYPGAAKALEPFEILNPLGSGLDPIFRFMFSTILRKEHVYRIMDIFTIEGYKALFRIGSFLLCFSLAHLSQEDLTDSHSFWQAFKVLAYSEKFHFDVLIDQTYGFQLKYGRKRPTYFPRRDFIRRLMEQNESWAENMLDSQIDESAHGQKNAQQLTPLGFVEGNIPMVLLKPASLRLCLTTYLPAVYRGNKLELVYSSNAHGKSWQAFYGACSKMKNCISIFEVLQNETIIGMFTTEPWHNSASKVYGDGGCFFFRLSPDPVCYHWQHKSLTISTGHPSGDEGMSSEVVEGALLESYMYSGDDFIAMGANQSGSSGLRIYQYLSKGSSSTASGFNNEPLVGAVVEFDIGLVEVYRLIL